MADLVFTAAFDADTMMAQAAKMEAASAKWEAERLKAAKANEAAILATKTDAIDRALSLEIAHLKRMEQVRSSQAAKVASLSPGKQEENWAANSAAYAQRINGIAKTQSGLMSLNRTAALTQLIFARLIFPALAAERIVRATVYINELKVAAINAGQELQRMGDAFVKATNERVRASRAQESDNLPGAPGGKAEAERIEAQRRADQQELQNKHQEKLNELEQESLGKKGLRFFTGTKSAAEQAKDETDAFEAAKAQRDRAAASELAELKARVARENAEKARKQQDRASELRRLAEDADNTKAQESAAALGNRGRSYESQAARDLADYQAQIIAIGRIVDLTKEQRKILTDSAFDLYRSKGAAIDRQRAVSERKSALDLKDANADAAIANAKAMRQQADMTESLGGSSAAAAASRIAAARAEAAAENAKARVELDRKLAEIDDLGDSITNAEKLNRQGLANEQMNAANKATQAALVGSIVDEVAKGRDLRGLVGKVGAGEGRYASQLMYGGDYQSKMYNGQQTLIQAVIKLPALIQQIADNTKEPALAVFGP